MNKIILTESMFSKNFFDRYENEIYFTLSEEGTIVVCHRTTSENPEFAEIEVCECNGSYVYEIDVFSCSCGYVIDVETDEQLNENTSIEDAIVKITQGICSDVCEYITYLSSIKSALEKF